MPYYPPKTAGTTATGDKITSGNFTVAANSSSHLASFLSGSTEKAYIDESGSAYFSTVYVGPRSGTSNTALGQNSAFALNINSSNNVSIGDTALKLNASSSNNTAVGYRALSGTLADRNTAVGSSAGYQITHGYGNVAVGSDSLMSNFTGTFNTVVGYNAGSNLFSDGNTLIGTSAGANITHGTSNVVVGQALSVNNTGSYNTAIGNYSLYSTTGSYNVALGYRAGYGSKGGENNVYIGNDAAQSINTGSNTVAIGYQTLYSATSGTKNIAIGYQAGYAVVTGTRNILIGDVQGEVSQSDRITIGFSSEKIGYSGSYFRVNAINVVDNAGNWVGNPISAGAATSIASGNFTVAANSSSHLASFLSSSTEYAFVDKTGSAFFSGSVGVGISTPASRFEIQAFSGSELAATGSEILTTSNWSLGANWSGDFTNGFTHTAGSTAALTNSTAISNSTRYYFKIIIVSGWTAGTLTVSFGGWTSPDLFSPFLVFGPTTQNTNTLSIVPSSDFNGTVKFSLKQITGISTSMSSVRASNGTDTWLETRAGYLGVTNPLYPSLFLGYQAGQYNMEGNDCLGIGPYSLSNNTTGYNNFALGSRALQNNTYGYKNIAIGAQALQAMTNGNSNIGIGDSALGGDYGGTFNVAMGRNALVTTNGGSDSFALGYASMQFHTQSSYNVAIGSTTLRSVTGGDSNIAIGWAAGRYYGAGGSTTTSVSRSIFIGHDARPGGNTQGNQIVIGYSAIGSGSNTTVIGNSSTTATYIGGTLNGNSAYFSGSVGIGTASPAYTLQVSGSFAATTKSFVIKHPTKPGMKLVHGALEGPEHGVYVRGELKGENLIKLPDYWEGLIDTETITVQLTPCGRHQQLFVESIQGLRVTVGGGDWAGVTCYYLVQATRKDVSPLEIEVEEE